MAQHKLHQVFKAYESNEIDSAFNIINNISISTIDNKNIKGYNSLMIKLFIKKNMMENLEKFIENIDNMMSRDYITILEYFYNIDKRKGIIFFLQKIMKKILNNDITFKPKDINSIISINDNTIIKSLVGLGFKTSLDGIDINIPSYSFSEKILIQYMEKIKSTVDNSTISKIISFDYDTVIDGGNVLHYEKGKLTDKSYVNLDNLIKSYNGNPLIILHSRHIKKYNKIIGKKYNVVFTPLGQNDDIYIIIASMMRNAMIITNDNFGDHNEVFSKDNFLRNYFDEKTIKYSYCCKGKYIFEKIKYSIIRIINNIVFIPSIKGGFFLYNLN